ncbi:MAG: hypothetical protein M3O30_05460 [Planctomycetota bacterium]|nr:hypothetical protein [Planctomycetota bacterium]
MRIFAGIVIFTILATTDLIKNGRNATRWREYCFLLLCVAVAIAYGIFNDQITSRISWEYFYYGKELAPIIGPQTPPDAAALSWQAARIGASATWWAGLLVGATMLIANNPSRRLPQLSYANLGATLTRMIGIEIICALLLGAAGYRFLLNWMSADFTEMAASGLWRPRHFLAVYGIHLGGYVGGVLGMVYAVVSIRRRRQTLARGEQCVAIPLHGFFKPPGEIH